MIPVISPIFWASQNCNYTSKNYQTRNSMQFSAWKSILVNLAWSLYSENLFICPFVHLGFYKKLLLLTFGWWVKNFQMFCDTCKHKLPIKINPMVSKLFQTDVLVWANVWCVLSTFKFFLLRTYWFVKRHCPPSEELNKNPREVLAMCFLSCRNNKLVEYRF